MQEAPGHIDAFRTSTEHLDSDGKLLAQGTCADHCAATRLLPCMSRSVLDGHTSVVLKIQPVFRGTTSTIKASGTLAIRTVATCQNLLLTGGMWKTFLSSASVSIAILSDQQKLSA